MQKALEIFWRFLHFHPSQRGGQEGGIWPDMIKPPPDPPLFQGEESRFLDQKAKDLADRLVKVPRATTPQGRPGTGQDFWQFRDYRMGESAQNIDWRASARSMTPLVREREWQAPRPLYIWQEDTPDMDFCSIKNGMTRREVAQVITLALALVIGETLSPPPQGAMGEYNVLYIGGFWQTPLDLPPAPFGFMLHLIDPAEMHLPYQGPHLFEAQGVKTFLANPSAVRAAYQDRIEAHCSALREYTAQRGAGYVLCQTDQDLLPSLTAAWHFLCLET